MRTGGTPAEYEREPSAEAHFIESVGGVAPKLVRGYTRWVFVARMALAALVALVGLVLVVMRVPFAFLLVGSGVLGSVSNILWRRARLALAADLEDDIDEHREIDKFAVSATVTVMRSQEYVAHRIFSGLAVMVVIIFPFAYGLASDEDRLAALVFFGIAIVASLVALIRRERDATRADHIARFYLENRDMIVGSFQKSTQLGVPRRGSRHPTRLTPRRTSPTRPTFRCLRSSTRGSTAWFGCGQAAGRGGRRTFCS